jgi:hypothetical protein
MPETSSRPQPELVVPERVVPERVVTERTVPERVVPERVVPERVVPEPPRDMADRRVAESGDAASTDTVGDRITEQVYAARDGLAILLDEAQRARVGRAEAAGAGGAVCAWNHFENIPTFYNWNNRPR